KSSNHRLTNYSIRRFEDSKARNKKYDPSVIVVIFDDSNQTVENIERKTKQQSRNDCLWVIQMTLSIILITKMDRNRFGCDLERKLIRFGCIIVTILGLVLD
ncbi:hypothetical protein SSS_09807, partial [Sarcoptes scabiei]